MEDLDYCINKDAAELGLRLIRVLDLACDQQITEVIHFHTYPLNGCYQELMMNVIQNVYSVLLCFK